MAPSPNEAGLFISLEADEATAVDLTLGVRVLAHIDIFPAWAGAKRHTHSLTQLTVSRPQSFQRHRRKSVFGRPSFMNTKPGKQVCLCSFLVSPQNSPDEVLTRSSVRHNDTDRQAIVFYWMSTIVCRSSLPNPIIKWWKTLELLAEPVEAKRRSPRVLWSDVDSTTCGSMYLRARQSSLSWTWWSIPLPSLEQQRTLCHYKHLVVLIDTKLDLSLGGVHRQRHLVYRTADTVMVIKPAGCALGV